LLEVYEIICKSPDWAEFVLSTCYRNVRRSELSFAEWDDEVDVIRRVCDMFVMYTSIHIFVNTK
jgi:hypothetical protein